MALKYFGTDGFRGRANEGLDVEHAFKTDEDMDGQIECYIDGDVDL